MGVGEGPGGPGGAGGGGKEEGWGLRMSPSLFACPPLERPLCGAVDGGDVEGGGRGGGGCSGHGECVRGVCLCRGDWIGALCGKFLKNPLYSDFL
jgi:hypothetical protein